MKDTVIKTWPLFFGLGMMMIGNGLQGTLLGIRAGIEGFSVFTTGIIMSAYYVGFLLGTIQVPKFITGVGHIRVFAALASLASTTILVHGIFLDPFMWIFVRVVSGFAFAGLYLVVESWLNDAATNETRGTILGLYMVVSYVGMAIGQFFLNFAEPSEMELFVMVSILVSLALVPISLSRRPAPDFSAGETIWISTIWKRSPLGLLGVTASGVATAIIFGIAPVFAQGIGLSNASISGFMAAFLIGSVLFQMPVAYVSDKLDRRKVIIALSLASTLAASILFLVDPARPWIAFVAMACLGAAALPIYGQCISHVNDHLSSRQFVAASATLLLMNGAGAVMGPMLVTGLMQIVGVNGFTSMLVGIFAVISGFGIYRAYVAPPVPLEDQHDAILMPARGSGVSIYQED